MAASSCRLDSFMAEQPIQLRGVILASRECEGSEGRGLGARKHARCVAVIFSTAQHIMSHRITHLSVTQPETGTGVDAVMGEKKDMVGRRTNQ